MIISDALKLSMMDIGCDVCYIQHSYGTKSVSIQHNTSIAILDTDLRTYLSYIDNYYTEIC